MTDKNEQEFQQLHSFFEALLGKEIADHIFVDIQENPAEFFSAPETFKARLEDKVSAYVENVGLTKVLLDAMSAMPDMLNYNRELDERALERDQELVAQLKGGEALVSLMISAAKTSIRTDVVEAIRVVEEIEVTDLTLAGPGLARMIEVAKDDPDSITFEENARTIAGALAHSGERVYRPMLKLALSITRLAIGRSADTPNELGATIAQAKDFWAANQPELMGLIEDRIRIIRNSESHKDTVIDPRAETITFVNRPKGRPPEELTFTKETFGAFVGEYMQMTLAFGAVYRLVKRAIAV